MAYIVKIPTQVTIDGQAIDNLKVTIQGSTANVSVYANLENSTNPGVVLAGPQNFNIQVNRNWPGAQMKTEFLAKIKSESAEWATNEVKRIQFQTLLDTNITESEIETYVNG